MRSCLHASLKKQFLVVLKMVASSSGVLLNKEKFSTSLLGTPKESAMFLSKATSLSVDLTIALSEPGTFQYHFFDLERTA